MEFLEGDGRQFITANPWSELLFVSFELDIFTPVTEIDVRVVWRVLMFLSLMTIFAP